MKKVKGFRLSEEVLKDIQEIAKKEGITQTDVIEKAVKSLKENIFRNEKEIQLLEEQNKNLQVALSSVKIALESKENELNAFKLLLDEKDERIKELQERLKEKNKPFWKFWK